MGCQEDIEDSEAFFELLSQLYRILSQDEDKPSTQLVSCVLWSAWSTCALQVTCVHHFLQPGIESHSRFELLLTV